MQQFCLSVLCNFFYSCVLSARTKAKPKQEISETALTGAKEICCDLSRRLITQSNKEYIKLNLLSCWGSQHWLFAFPVSTMSPAGVVFSGLDHAQLLEFLLTNHLVRKWIFPHLYMCILSKFLPHVFFLSWLNPWLVVPFYPEFLCRFLTETWKKKHKSELGLYSPFDTLKCFAEGRVKG